MMKYEDALQDCIEGLRRGRSLEGLLAAHPGHAERLRQDLDAISAVRQLSRTLPAPSGSERAAERLRTALAEERRGRAVAVTQKARGAGWLSPLRGAGLAAGALAVVLVVALGALALPRLSGSAEASTLEGVVVDNANGVITLQTEDGLKDVSLAEGAAVTDPAGARLDASKIQTGQVLQVKGKRVGQGAVVARLVNLKASGELQTWCAQHQVRCQELSQTLQLRVEQCRENAPSCQQIKTLLQSLRGHLGDLSSRDDLKHRCDQADKPACKELASFCGERPVLCKTIAGFLKSHHITPGAPPQ